MCKLYFTITTDEHNTIIVNEHSLYLDNDVFAVIPGGTIIPLLGEGEHVFYFYY